jgi:hypothetical protein
MCLPTRAFLGRNARLIAPYFYSYKSSHSLSRGLVRTILQATLAPHTRCFASEAFYSCSAQTYGKPPESITMYKLLFLSLTASVAIAADMSLMLFARQSCQLGEKVCGTGCISAIDTCCPDGSGGCPVSQYCELGSNNQYGCCPIGDTCSGNGGVGSCSSQGQTDCGSGCIDLGWTCCPDGSGGCGPTEYCVLGSNNQYGCCPNGQDCSGGGGGGGGGGGNGSCASQNQQDCGSGCIDLSWTCCPDGSGGCPASQYCELGSNNQYGCCPIGEICTGSGGASTIGAGTVGETDTDITNSTPPPTEAPTTTQAFTPTTETPIVTTPATSTTPSKSAASTIPLKSAASTTPSKSAAITTSAVPANSAASEDYGATSAAHILRVVLAALFIFF